MPNNKLKREMEEMNREQRKGTSLITVSNPHSLIAEQFKIIRTNILFSMVDEELKTIVFTSSGPYEGKSTVAANVAAVFADEGKKVILVDADLRKPSLNRTFQLENHLGLSTLITSKDTRITDVVYHDREVNIDIITSGPIPPNPSELLNSKRMEEIIKQLENMYDLVLFDMPPVVSVTDAQIMASKSDGVVFVIRRNVAYTEDVKQAKQLLDRVQANVLGVVYNGEEKKNDRSYDYYGYKES